MLYQIFISLRPKQWTKNLLIFASLIFSLTVFYTPYLIKSVIAFFLFSFVAGSIYIINDIQDYESDRKHPYKSKRPIASGKLSKKAGALAALVISVSSIAGAYYLNPLFCLATLLYFFMFIGYSFWFKHVVIVDVLFIAFGFLIRTVAGALAIEVNISSWLLICTIFLSLFLALSKRRSELNDLSSNAAEHRRILSEYSPILLDQMISVATASSLMAYALYTMAPQTISKFGTTHLNLTIPFVLYAIFRYLYLIHQKQKGGDPSSTLINDRPLLFNIAIWTIVVVIIIYGPAYFKGR